MWILPKQLHTSAYVPDTAVLISDLAEQSQLCEQSLLVRSKPSLARTWSQRWRRDSWTQHLSGRILKPSHGQTFVTAWTSCLEVTPASHSQQQASDSDEMTPDTSGHGSQMELFPCDPESASSRTSRDTSASDSERSSASWKNLVIRQRGEYSLRVKLAHLTNASGSSFWPTCAARDYKGESGAGRQERKGNPADTLPNAVAQQYGQAAPAKPSTNGNRLESWGTPSCMDTLPARSPEALARAKLKGGCKNLREEVHQWATPRTGATDNSRPNNKGGIPLGDQARRAEQWITPQACHIHALSPEVAKRDMEKGNQITLRHQNPGKLNPRWVETLMGLPIGWTMPSCASPVTIAPTNCDCLETESCQPPQPELF